MDRKSIEPFGLGALEPEYGKEVFLELPTKEEPSRSIDRPLEPPPPIAVEPPPVVEPFQRPQDALPAVRLGGFYGIENPFLIYHAALSLAGVQPCSFYFATIADRSQFCVFVFSNEADRDAAHGRLRYFPFNGTVASVVRLGRL
jgi:hypothetical protein